MTIQEITPEVQASADKLLKEFELLTERVYKMHQSTAVERQDLQFSFLLLQIARLDKRIEEISINRHKPLGLKRKDLLIDATPFETISGEKIFRVVCSDNSLPKTLHEGTYSQCEKWINFNCVD